MNKAFIRPHVDYRDIVFDQGLHKFFYQRFEYIQHDRALAIPGAIRRTSKDKLYQELSL